MADNKLNVAPRSVTGKKVAALRRGGQTPANVYGHRLESRSVQAFWSSQVAPAAFGS